ncbi:MAG TPA: xanthine dehydrogenase family protein subunit M [Xanthobacteraceae bacterium]|nr:xanthine dehydrogenase family protein subunit M [Xanthobacteraceae bacterium]
MKPAAFAYAQARSLDHAIALLSDNEDARILAGGQSLMATLNMRLSSPSLLIDINCIEGLDAITERDGIVEIGALVRHAQAEQSPVIARAAPLIAAALPHIAHPAIRNRGTLAGSIAFADPAAELPACLMALAGEVEIQGPDGKRRVHADDFFQGLFETALGPHDIITAIRVPAARPQTRIGFAELARRHGDYAMVGLAACARADGQKLRDVRLCYFGVGATPLRARQAEALLTHGSDDDQIEKACAALAQDLDPADDVQASGKVKLHLAGVLLKRVVRQLLEPRS